MLSKIEVRTARSADPVLQLPFDDVATESLQLLGVDGLDPVKAAITTTPYGSGNGEAYNGSSVGKRNIVMRFGLNPDWATQTMTSLRQELYKYFMPQQAINLRFYHNVLPITGIDGYVEGLEANIFSPDPEVQVSVICPSPDFVAITSTQQNGALTTGISDTHVDYEGSVPTGFDLWVQSDTPRPAYTGSITIRLNQTVDPIMLVNPVTVDTTKAFRMRSLRGIRAVQNLALPSLTPSSLLKVMDNSSRWPELDPGLNLLSVIASATGQKWFLEYYARFGGL